MSSTYHIDTLVDMAYSHYDVETLFLGGFQTAAISGAIARLDKLTGYNKQYYDKLCGILAGQDESALILEC